MAESVSFCFDLMQVHYLPHLTIGEAFYRSQLSFYAFAICNANPKRSEFKAKPTFYKRGWDTKVTEAQKRSKCRYTFS